MLCCHLREHRSLVSLGLRSMTLCFYMLWFSYFYVRHLYTSLLHTLPFFQPPWEALTMSRLPLQDALIPFEERQQGNVKYGDGGLFKGGWWMETSWHFKWQHLKGSGIFLKHRQEISVTSYWFGLHILHLIQWLIWMEAARMLGFHLVSLKAYRFWFILSSFVQGCFIAKGWMTGFPAGCQDR